MLFSANEELKPNPVFQIQTFTFPCSLEEERNAVVANGSRVPLSPAGVCTLCFLSGSRINPALGPEWEREG